MFDIKSVKSEAQQEIAKERAEKAKNMLKAQLKVIETARQVLANEERKLADIEAAIAEGNVR